MKNEKKFNVCIDIEGFSKKPDKYRDTPKIVLRIANYTQSISLPDLAKEVTLPDAHSWTPATFNESYNSKGKLGYWRNNDGWKEQQIFTLDFDEGISFKEIEERFKKYKINPCFAYTTFSDIDNTKFRLVFIVPEVIKDKKIFYIIQLSLMTLFPEADTQCKDPSRMYHGGKEIIYEDYNTEIDIYPLIQATCRFLHEKDKTNYSRNIKNYCRMIGLNTINSNPHIVEEEILVSTLENSAPDTINNTKGVNEDENMTNSLQLLYTYYRCGADLVKKRYTLYLSNSIKSSASDKKSPKYNISNEIIKREKCRNIDFEKMAEKCQLYKEFINGEYWAYHQELFGLATNLLCCEGGKEQFFKGLSSRTDYGDKVNEFYFYANWINNSCYAPQRCKNFCLHSQTCKHGLNIIETTKLQRGHVNIISTPTYQTIESARNRLRESFSSANSSTEKKINIIKASTGVGKTETILDNKESIIAVPRHELKNEIAVRMENFGNEVLITPKLPEMNITDNKNIEALYAIGAYSRASIYLRNMAKKSDPLILNYLNELDEARKSSKTVITTHERMLYFNDTKKKKLIIDEDPIQTILKQGQITLKDLITFRLILRSYTRKTEIIDDIINIIEKMPTNKAEEMGTYIHDDLKEFESELSYELTRRNITSNIFGFLNCSYYIKQEFNGETIIDYIVKRNLPDKNIIIMSATVNELIYKKLFSDKVEFTDIGHVELKGKLIQYPERSYSRYQLKNEKEHLSFLKSIIKDDPVITYKAYENEFPNTIATFGNLSGLDKFSGKNICIAGTPNCNPVTYVLYALALGYKITPLDLEMKYVPVEYNGFEFYFNTYSDNPDLRQIQFYLIESELQQAIGRARLISNDCTVTLFSNFPIPGAEFKYFTKEKDNQISA